MIEATQGCSDLFFIASGAMVSEWKIDFCLVWVDDSLAWIPHMWNYILLEVIAH
jgi:hypothetical protein